ncbi:hypothetical protein RFI_25618, partial [Reticulomyxa filosa]
IEKTFRNKKKMAVRELFDLLKKGDETVAEEEQRKQAVFSCMINSDIKKCDYLKTKQLRSPSSMACQLEEPLFAAKLLKKGIIINGVLFKMYDIFKSKKKNLIIINKG